MKKHERKHWLEADKQLDDAITHLTFVITRPIVRLLYWLFRIKPPGEGDGK